MERELRGILETFAASGWDELAVPARRFLAGELTAPASPTQTSPAAFPTTPCATCARPSASLTAA